MVVDLGQITARCGVGARTREIGVGIVFRPYLAVEIDRHKGEVGGGVAAPEVHRLSVGVPIVVARTLEEDRSVEAHPADASVNAVGECRARVAQYLAVARLVDGFTSFIPEAVAVQIDEFQVAGQPASGQAAAAVSQVDLFGVGLGLLVGLEESVGDEAPDFADLHALVVILIERFVGIVVFGDDALVVADVESDAVLERFACQLELVAPVDGELVSLGAQVGCIHVGKGGAVDAGQCDAVGQHVLRVAHIDVGCQVEPVAQHRYVETQVPLLGGLPRQVGSDRRSQRGVFAHAAVAEGEAAEIVARDQPQVGVIGRYVLVAQRIERGAQFEVVDHVLRTAEEGFLRDTPTHRRRREPAPAAV